MIKVSVKIVSSIIGIAAVGVISVAASTTIPLIQQSVSSQNESSSVMSNSNLVSSKEAQNVDDSVTEIQKATDEGVSVINQTTSDTLKQIQDDAPSSSESVSMPSSNPISHTFSAVGQITVTEDVIIKRHNTKNSMNILVSCPDVKFSDDESNKFVSFKYYSDNNIASFDSVEKLKAEGFTITNLNGDNIDFTCDNSDSPKEFKVKYNDISEISTMYLKYKDQTITIKVS